MERSTTQTVNNPAPRRMLLEPEPMEAQPGVEEASFLLRDAMTNGLGAGALRHPRWVRPFRGVRSRQPPARSLQGRALQYVPRLREGDLFSHATALALLGCPIRVPTGCPVDVSSPAAAGPVVCRGVVGHRHSSPVRPYPCMLPEVEGWIDVVPPLTAALQSATQLPCIELVVALDYLLLDDPLRYDPRLTVTPGELEEFARRVSGRGVARFREAARLARVGAESRMETLMRLCAERVGMPELQLQRELYTDSGRWIGRFDAVDEATRSVYEYDGEQHTYSTKQRRRDSEKHQLARDAGWRVLVLFARDVVEEPIGTGRRMLEFGGQRPRRVSPASARALDERLPGDTESAIPYRSAKSRLSTG